MAGQYNFVEVAHYSPHDGMVRQRLFTILREHHIEADGIQESVVHVYVPSLEAAEARRLISELIDTEKLSITVIQ